jgi:uncharacterized protein
MRLYAVADIHGRPERMDAIQRNVEKYRPDVLVTAGDIASLRRASFVSGLGDIRIPVLAIRGNTDSKQVESWFAQNGNIIFLNNRDVILQGTHFAGASGTIPVPFRSRIAFRETAIWNRLIPRITPQTVLIAHPPPWGCLDRVLGKYHAGCRSLGKVVLRHQPDLLICGHIHEDAGMAYLGRTLIVNCAMGNACEGAVIDIQNGRIAVDILRIQRPGQLRSS